MHEHMKSEGRSETVPQFTRRKLSGCAVKQGEIFSAKICVMNKKARSLPLRSLVYEMETQANACTLWLILLNK